MLASQVSIDNYAGNWSHCKLKIVWNCISFYFYRHNFQRSQKIWEFIEFCEATSIGSEKKTLIDKLISQKIALRFFQLVQLILSKIDKTISRNAIILIAPDWLEIILYTFCHVTLLFQFYQSDYPACLIYLACWPTIPHDLNFLENFCILISHVISRILKSKSLFLSCSTSLFSFSQSLNEIKNNRLIPKKSSSSSLEPLKIIFPSPRPSSSTLRK